MFTPTRFSQGHYGQRIGKSITLMSEKPACSQCGLPFPPGTWLITGPTA